MHKREKLYADMLDKNGIKWLYSPKKFDLPGCYYRPDFYLPDEDLYVEIAGTRQAYNINKNKYKIFQSIYPKLNFVVLRPDGISYFTRKKRENNSVGKVKLLLRLPAELHSLLREKSYKGNISINKIIISTLEKELKDEK